MAKLRIEKWIQERGIKREIHYYIGDEYVFGFAPRFFSKRQVSKIIKRIKRENELG